MPILEKKLQLFLFAVVIYRLKLMSRNKYFLKLIMEIFWKEKSYKFC